MLGPLIVTDVLSFVNVMFVPALRAFNVVPANNCVEFAGADAVSESRFELNLSCKVHDTPVVANVILWLSVKHYITGEINNTSVINSHDIKWRSCFRFDN